MQRFLTVALLAASVVIYAGCTDSEAKKARVSGLVTVEGAPLPAGLIMFRSVKDGVLDTIEIKDGKFAGEALPGPARRVEIGAYETMVMGSGTMESKVQVNKVAPEFNDNTTLTADVQPSGKNEYQFDVKMKK